MHRSFFPWNQSRGYFPLMVYMQYPCKNRVGVHICADNKAVLPAAMITLRLA